MARSRLARLLVVLPLLASSELRAQTPVCVQDFPERLMREIKVPLGCDLVDCCVDCPAGPLDLRVEISGSALSGAELKLPGAGGRPAEPISVPSGQTVVPAVVERGRSGPAPLASIRLRPERAVLDRWIAGATRSDAAGAPGHASVEISQLAGPVVVSSTRLAWKLVSCLTSSPCDQITLTGNAGGDDSVTQLDARREAGCTEYEVGRSTSSQPVGSLLDEGTCRSEVSVYSSENAMAIVEEVDVWTDVCGDTLTVDLDPILSADASFILVVPEPIAELEWGQTVDWVAKLDLAYANAVYDDNKTGISFGMDIVELSLIEQLELAWLLPTALLKALVVGGFDVFDVVCAIPGQFEAKGYYVPGRLNVYYMALPFAGLTCEDDRNIIFVGLWKKPATLAHELGHSLSLLGDVGHTNELPGFAPENVMWTGGSELRHHLSLGQVFRQNVEETSTLNRNGVRADAERSCVAPVPSKPCPPLALDWARP